MLGQIMVILIGFIVIFSYTPWYRKLKIKLINYLNDQLIKYVSKQVPGLMMMGNMNSMMNSMMNDMIPVKQERISVVRDNKIYIPFTLSGSDYTIGMDFNPNVSTDTKICGVTHDRNIISINHHPGVNFMLKAEDLGFQSIRVYNDTTQVYKEYHVGEIVVI